MAKVAERAATTNNGQAMKPATSGLGRKLRRLSEKIAASGEKPLTRRELERELAERRGGIR